MEIPLTPALVVMQTQKPRSAYSQQTIQAAANEITALLDDFTFGEQETRILEILADLGPEDFVRCLKLISQYTVLEGWRKPKEVSYLQRLYEDMNGEEFRGLCEMMKSKLLAVKAGSLEHITEVAKKALKGETTPEIPVKVDFGPSKLMAPSSWQRRSFPFDTEFNEDGSIAGKWAEHVGYLDALGTVRPFKMQMTELWVVRHIHTPGKNKYVSLLDIKNMSDKQHRDFFFTNVNIVGIVLGMGMFAAAKGLLAKQALVGLFQVAIPTAGQFVTDHEEEILEMKYGPDFLFAWQILNLAMAAYGLYQLFSPAGKSIIASMIKSKDDLISNNPGVQVAQDAAQKVTDVQKALDDVKTNVVDKGVEPMSQSSGRGANPFKNRAPIDPSVPPPPITGGKCIATGETELEILYEVRKHPNPEKLDVFQADNDKGFILVERTGNDMTDKPTGFTGCANFTKIIDIFEDIESAKKKLLDAAKFHAQSEIEVGIFKRTIGGKERYAVVDGQVGSVKAPAPNGWTSVGHYHHGGDGQIAFHYPAVQDMAGTLIMRARWEKQAEIIFSRDASGKVIEIEYGFDPDFPDAPFYVKTLDGAIKWFSNMFPDSIQSEVNLANSRQPEAHRLAELVKVFKKLDPAKKYYAAWWASLFP